MRFHFVRCAVEAHGGPAGQGADGQDPGCRSWPRLSVGVKCTMPSIRGQKMNALYCTTAGCLGVTIFS